MPESKANDIQPAKPGFSEGGLHRRVMCMCGIHNHMKLWGGLGAYTPPGNFEKLDDLKLLWDRSRAAVATLSTEHCIQFLAVYVIHVWIFAKPVWHQIAMKEGTLHNSRWDDRWLNQLKILKLCWREKHQAYMTDRWLDYHNIRTYPCAFSLWR